MLTLTHFERRVRRLLVDHVTQANGNVERALITYGELDELLGDERREGDPTLAWPSQPFFEALGHVSMYEVEHGRAMLTAVVVENDTRLPGEGFGRLADHLGFDFDDEHVFWTDEVDAVLDLWAPAFGDDRGVDALVGVVDRGTEVIDKRLRGVERAVRRGGDLPYLARTISWPPTGRIAWEPVVRIKNVGTAPAIDALYVGMGQWTNMHRTDVFHLAAGESADLRLRKAASTRDERAMGHTVDGVVEVLVCGEGTGRWLRLLPHITQKADIWIDGRAEPPYWLSWYRTVMREIAYGRS